jgi:hypothetical protein
MPAHRGPQPPRSSKARGFNRTAARKCILIWCEGKETEPNYFQEIIDHHKLTSVMVNGRSAADVEIGRAKGNTLQLCKDAEAQQGSGSSP